ncbi:MAG: hypothetical protein PVI59_10625 [Anaerolineae bacterium]|jgi:hypothetical protein
MKSYSYNAKYRQPVEVAFQCEYCGRRFTASGTISTEVGVGPWLRPNPSEAAKQLREKARHELEEARDEFEGKLEKRLFPPALSSDEATLTLEGSKECPKCGYSQRMYEKPEVSLFQKILLNVLGFGCLGFLVLLYVGLLVGVLREGPGGPYEIPILIGAPLAVLLIGYLVLKFGNPHREFMEQHELEKDDLPAPREPEIRYGRVSPAR